ncbi:MAG: imidazole glycerol phosphate synthase cyclase subunit [Defluviitaleaceae bacterium]|nr:imidazole glycerol phosphate synthase cyclase subunit [Defluviitaleaceae bacterium]MCL2263661.1 imidazole glycerol phosphate synthase cyclase subunit [Defluviitaleaceae bacterium]MCL2263894.1 imidazole glycerol phosphate synthase cyclase subunit [Defluviitaleaceae bacterium]MCL2264152.1 imidazole glycerol phosphate synthase cyclase subunit [Defluviitaleaceae bacterium]
MLTKRLIACFDIVDGRVTKAIQFQDNIDVAAADVLAGEMYNAQIDELIFYDIHASSEKRLIDIETVKKVAARVFVPFTVGGGIKDLNGMYEALKAGAEKISVDSMAVRTPEIIREGAKAFGSQCVVLSTQVKRDPAFPSGYQVYIDGARTATGLDAIEWLKRCEDLGAGEICLNSIDCDGTLQGYDLPLMKKAEAAVRVPLIASGGAGEPSHLSDLFTQTQAQAAIISSMLYSPRLQKNYTPKELKQFLSDKGVSVRPFV